MANYSSQFHVKNETKNKMYYLEQSVKHGHWHNDTIPPEVIEPGDEVRFDCNDYNGWWGNGSDAWVKYQLIVSERPVTVKLRLSCPISGSNQIGATVTPNNASISIKTEVDPSGHPTNGIFIIRND